MATPRFVVSALKHRPSTFAEVLAQDHVIQTLRHSIERDRIANAYIFAGSRGTGKTTTARIFAKAINCTNRQDIEPCNQCDSCVAVTRGTHPDVIEIDAASNRGIDEIKQLRESTRFTPTQSPYKVYVIDESHMLTREANNALLKTLEEPPPHCKFIFATTELNKVPGTILSRCQRFTFRRIPTAVIREHLSYVLNSQTERAIRPSPDLDSILYHIARASQGVLRDALVLLDQVLAFCSEEPRLSEAQQVLGVIEFEQLGGFIQAILDDRPAELIQTIEDAARQGRDMRLFLLEALRHLRALAIASIHPEHPDLLELPAEMRTHILQQAKSTSLEQLLYVTDQFWEAERRLTYAADARLVMEMSAIKAAKVAQAVKIPDLLKKIGKTPATVVAAPTAGSAPVASAPEKPLSAPEPETPSPEPADPPPEETSAPSPQAASAVETEPPAESEPAPEKPAPPSDGLSDSSWQHLLATLDESNKFLAGCLAESRLVEWASSEITISLPPGSQHAKQRLEQNHDKVGQVVQQVYGKPLRVRYTIRAEEAPAEADSPEPPKKPAATNSELITAAQDHPMFSLLTEKMAGHIRDFRPEASSR